MGVFEIVGRLFVGLMLTIFVSFLLLVVGDSAPGGGEDSTLKTVAYGLYIWLMVLALSVGIFQVFYTIFAPFFAPLF